MKVTYFIDRPGVLDGHIHTDCHRGIHRSDLIAH